MVKRWLWMFSSGGICLLMTGHCIAFTPESPEVKRLIRRAVLFLQKQPDDNPGEAALTAYSLMKAGEPVQHPKVRYAVDECLEICSTPEKVSALLGDAPGVTVMDERKDGGYPTAVTEGANEDAVFVGRIREDISHERGINLWVVSDNVRKGAALNSVQIAEMLVKSHL